MPMTLKESKAELDELVERVAEHFRQVRELQLEIGEKLKSANEAHGVAVLPWLVEYGRKMSAATLYATPIESLFKM